jgi:insertion element IS1 protein InsB
MPPAYRQRTTLYTEHSVVYATVIPAAHDKAIRTLARTTPHIARCNTTLRQRVSRLVRDAWSFSTTLANHVGALTLFLCHDTLTRAAA